MVYFMQSFREEVECLAATWDRLQREGEEWAEHLVPDEHLGELPSEESGFSSPGEIQDSYVQTVNAGFVDPFEPTLVH